MPLALLIHLLSKLLTPGYYIHSDFSIIVFIYLIFISFSFFVKKKMGFTLTEKHGLYPHRKKVFYIFFYILDIYLFAIISHTKLLKKSLFFTFVFYVGRTQGILYQGLYLKTPSLSISIH